MDVNLARRSHLAVKLSSYRGFIVSKTSSFETDDVVNLLPATMAIINIYRYYLLRLLLLIDGFIIGGHTLDVL